MQEVCVVVPCYNEAHRLRCADFLAFVDAHPHVSLCFVDDGSADRTAAALEELRQARPDHIIVHRLAVNGGKAAAVREGVLHVSKDAWPIVGYWDADLSTPLEEIDRLLAVLRSHENCALVMGSRVRRLGANIERRVLRHVLGRVFAACASGILGFHVYDSQCGAKLFRARLADALFGEPFVTRWLFDLEMLARLRNKFGPSAMEMAREVPLGQWQEMGGSKLKVSDMFHVPIELLRIRARYNRSG